MLPVVPLVVALLVGCGGGGSTNGAPASRSAGETAGRDSASTDWFVDSARATGLDFVYFNGVSAASRRSAENLRLYESGKPCRTPFSDDELP